MYRTALVGAYPWRSRSSANASMCGPLIPRRKRCSGVCQVICVNDLGFVVGVDLGVDLGVELGLMLVQSSVTRRRRGCGNVGIPRLLRDSHISTAKLFPGSCGEPVFVGC